MLLSGWSGSFAALPYPPAIVLFCSMKVLWKSSALCVVFYHGNAPFPRYGKDCFLFNVIRSLLYRCLWVPSFYLSLSLSISRSLSLSQSLSPSLSLSLSLIRFLTEEVIGNACISRIFRQDTVIFQWH